MKNKDHQPVRLLLLRILWVAFLVACAMEMLVFAFFDPEEMHWSGHTLQWSRQAIYTVAFFAFWIIAAVGCWITALLVRSDDQ